ncbi:unnamed protein product [Staurois parvus]|uniref:Uncharacterized protein n=1 Tax=Staurois parvus TaxID=386267 RepID=A0ABN9DWH9_9NEOB|nr:unnamed protein product [Staurois parvus]
MGSLFSKPTPEYQLYLSGYYRQYSVCVYLQVRGGLTIRALGHCLRTRGQ